MFCSIKNNRDCYNIYACTRKREGNKVKSSDKYIMSLQKEKIIKLSDSEIKTLITDKCISKGINDVSKVISKVLSIKKVVIQDNITTNNNVVTSSDIEIVDAEVVETLEPTYETTVFLDIQRDYNQSIKENINFSKLTSMFGNKSIDIQDIIDKSYNEIIERKDNINNSINEIIEEHKKINAINEKLINLNSNISLIQDIYVSIYNKIPCSEIWLVGNGYIKWIYDLECIVLPGEGPKKYESWNEWGLDNNKMYYNTENEDNPFEEIELIGDIDIGINKNDITGSLISLILSGKYSIDYTMSDYIDIDIDNDGVSLRIEHFIDWINKEPIKNYKITYESLLKYQDQLNKYNNIKKY